MRTCGGFSMVEIMVVLIIVAILAAISAPLMNSYNRRAMSAEGKALCASVASAETGYAAEHDTFVAVPLCSSGTAIINVDARTNQYFTSYQVGPGVTGSIADSLMVTANGSGDAAVVTVCFYQVKNGTSAVVVSGL